LRDYVHVLDLAAAHILALSSATTGVFNLGTGRGYSVKEVVEAARRVTGHPLPAEVVLRRPGDPACLIAAADKARTVLKWQPRFTELEPIIESAWAWHRAHPAGYQR
jgi:UDP-glucose 4-epimerase